MQNYTSHELKKCILQNLSNLSQASTHCYLYANFPGSTSCEFVTRYPHPHLVYKTDRVDDWIHVTTQIPLCYTHIATIQWRQTILIIDTEYASNTVYLVRYAHGLNCMRLRCFVVIISAFVWYINPYSSELFHVDQDFCEIAPVSIKWPWKIWVKSTIS